MAEQLKLLLQRRNIDEIDEIVEFDPRNKSEFSAASRYAR
jgi:hypothetical protein